MSEFNLEVYGTAQEQLEAECDEQSEATNYSCED